MNARAQDLAAESETKDILDFRTLVKAVASRKKLPAGDVRAVLRTLIELAADGLRNGQTVRIAGLGSLKVRERKLASAQPAAFSNTAKPRRVVLATSKRFNAAAGVA